MSAIDLGNLLNTYLNYRLARNQMSGIPQGWDPGAVTVSAASAGGGLPFVDVVPEPDASQYCSTKGLVYDPEKGKWIKRRRRRRRRLVTPTDIKDIAALKAIIGNGQALNSAVIKAVN